MAKKAVTIQERLEKLIADAEANPEGPDIGAAKLKERVAKINASDYKVTQAKLAVTQAVEARDSDVDDGASEAQKAEFTLKAHYGARAAKLKEYILPSDAAPARGSGESNAA